MRSAKYNYNDQVKDDERGRACSKSRQVYGFGGKATRKETNRKSET
jgi:hypothetical protein